jgi:alpha-tubulin suppressor-like RCC1 family protein
MKRAIAVLLAVAALPALAADPWSGLLRQGLDAATRELQRPPAQVPAAPKSQPQPAAPQATPLAPAPQVTEAPGASAAPVPLAATGGELLPLRRIPLITGAMGVNVLVEVDGTVQSWGVPQGVTNYLGDGSVRGRAEPAPIPGVRDVVDAVVAPGHVLLLLRDGTVLTWGGNQGCELTVKDDRKRPTPFQVKGVRNVVQVAAGHKFSAALLRDGTVMAWGSNDDGLLANGKSGWNEPCAIEPVVLEGLSGVKKLATNGESALALKQDGTVWGWGKNGQGELCDGTHDKARTRPVQIKGIANAVDIDISQKAMVVLANGTLWSCGSNAIPAQVAGIADAVAVRTANNTNFVRLRDGTLRAWGDGMFGMLGNGHVEGGFPKPTPPIGLGPVLEFYLAHTVYAIKSDGTVMAWAFYTGGAGEDAKQWQLKPVPWRKVRLAE